MKILIIRFSSIGDIVLTSPVIRCLRQQRPEVSLHFLVKASFKTVVAHNPHLNQIHSYAGDLPALIQTLKQEKFDLVLDLQRNRRSRKIGKALGRPRITFNKLNVLKWIQVNFKQDLLPDKSIVERYFHALRPLGIRNDGGGLEFFIPPEGQTRLDDIPMSHFAGYVAGVIGGSFPTKKFPVRQWINFCRDCPYPVVLLGGPDDREEGEAIAAAYPGKVYNACGKFNLLESADLIRRSKVVVSNDTGLMHIAAAFQKPLVSLWGNTTPEMGMFPYYGHNNLRALPEPRSAIFEVKPLSCRPCSKLGYQRCPKKHFKCMELIPAGEVASEVQRLWRASKLE